MIIKQPVLSLFLIGFLFFVRCQTPGGNSEPVDRHGHLIYTRHARCRMDCRHITDKEVKEILEKGQINFSKSEPNSRPDPKYAFEGYTDEGQHLRIVFAPSHNDVVVITCIELGIEWECHCN